MDPYRLTPKAGSKTRQGLWKCRACRKQFTVTVGTVFEDSHIPITKWLLAIHLLASSKKGMSAHQLHRMLGITYKTAWFMAHRLRYAMMQGPMLELFKGVVEDGRNLRRRAEQARDQAGASRPGQPQDAGRRARRARDGACPGVPDAARHVGEPEGCAIRRTPIRARN